MPQRQVGLLGSLVNPQQRSFGGLLGGGKRDELLGDHKPASAGALGSPEAKSIIRAEMTACASHAKRIASQQLVQNLITAIPGIMCLDVPEAIVLSAHDPTVSLKLCKIDFHNQIELSGLR